MIYCDTSLLGAAHVSETNSDAARKWLAANSDETLVVSDWVLTEFASAIALKVRRRMIDELQQRAIELRWRELLADTFRNVSVCSEHFHAAAKLAPTGRNGLRAGDARHLAIVLDHGLSLATFDDDSADAARSKGALVEIDRS